MRYYIYLSIYEGYPRINFWIKFQKALHYPNPKNTLKSLAWKLLLYGYVMLLNV